MKKLIAIILVITFPFISGCKKKEIEPQLAELSVETKVERGSGNFVTMSGIAVSLKYDEERMLIQKFTDSQGKVHFKNLPPGHYFILAKYHDYGTDANFVGSYTNNPLILKKGDKKTISIILIEGL